MRCIEVALREKQESVQPLLLSVEIALAMKQGVGALIRQAGLQLMQLVLERNVEQMLGPQYRQAEDRQAWRWGKEKGWCGIDGQKVPLDRQRVRNVTVGKFPREHARLQIVRLADYPLTVVRVREYPSPE